MKHLFDEWPEIRAKIEGASQVLVMLDFDGTLSPIVEQPDRAELPPETRRDLAELTTLADLHVAIVSGRAVQDVRRRVEDVYNKNVMNEKQVKVLAAMLELAQVEDELAQAGRRYTEKHPAHRRLAARKKALEQRIAGAAGPPEAAGTP